MLLGEYECKWPQETGEKNKSKTLRLCWATLEKVNYVDLKNVCRRVEGDNLNSEMETGNDSN